MRSENSICAPYSLSAVCQQYLRNSSLVCLIDDDPFVLSPFTCNILKWADIQMAVLFGLPLSNVSNYGKMALAYNIDINKSALTC